MGLLSEGSPLSWQETKKHVDHVKKSGIRQFLSIYRRLKDRQKDHLKWGDEIEYTLVHFDHERKTARLYLDGPKYLETLQEEEKRSPDSHPTTWRPEYGSYMLESTPGKPWVFVGDLSEFNDVEPNMKLRREEITKLLEGTNVSCLTVTTFPRIGCPDFTQPIYRPTPQPEADGASRSVFYPDQAIYPGHPRFRTLTRNIRDRRGSKVAMNLPIFRDANTPSPFVETFDDPEANAASLKDHVYLDCMGFGMGCSCLQMTFQACSVDEGKYLYDQLVPICPIVMALSAAAPIYRGYLVDSDCRWNVISGSVDCRTPEERGLKPLSENKFVIPKSRYGSVDCYLASDKYNDVPIQYEPEVLQELIDEGVDELLAKHIAHLFIRDTVSLFSEKIKQDLEKESDHFENIQSTNWQSMRFKPPPPNSDIGWRIEFRVCEVQVTDFENAAYAVFIVLLTRAIMSFGLNFYMPISKVDENMEKAQRRDAARAEKFYFRCQPFPGDFEVKAEDPEFSLMSVDTLINGKDGEFPGLIPLIWRYLDSVHVDAETHCTISRYLCLIERRASGKVLTAAQWMRQFVHSHPKYSRDSVVSDEINYDLMCAFDKIMKGQMGCPELLGKCDDLLERKDAQTS
ncbi:glutamate--cysteine ligase catalytic subunit-like isoform X2 [Oscarella lobularis]|uniref:glutamate--cysteine ligase catalytic subunit-like isoform X2 n=1 Tax=Oscarella lobularis TaxID=121494 RepID=UPI003314264D